ncbi:ribosomal protein L7/L12 [Kitasatospora sp. NPDC004669]|uniref:ribosomal protein L7/L12 n=1 Tax=Kitasatospora sp. NPDC004669 TaxID=3154555 RepID=UPI0033A16DBD
MDVVYVELVCDEEPNRVVLTDPGPHVLEVAKVIRRRTGLSLWHSKLLLGQLPATVAEDVSSDLAGATADELRAAGAAVEVQH